MSAANALKNYIMSVESDAEVNIIDAIQVVSPTLEQNEESDCRQHIDRMLNTMNENELTIMEATAEGIQKARETEGA